MSNVSEKREFYGKAEINYISTHYKYDKLDRIIEKSVQDSEKRIYRKATYHYDQNGLQNQIITYNQVGTSIEETLFNPHGDPIKSTNALGNSTHIQYHYPHANYIESTDPIGQITITNKDAENRITSVEIKDTFGSLLKKTAYRYDLAGNRRFCLETVLNRENSQKEVITAWEYDEVNRVVKLIEGLNASDQKITQYRYNLLGQMEKKIMPNGTEHHYIYDAFGRLEEHRSSDQSIHYTYKYDLNDNVKAIYDHINNCATFRDYDENDRIIKETLGNGLNLSYAYDDLGREIEVTLPDNSFIRYQYEGPNLRNVLRLSPQGKLWYQHTYDKYDQSGNILSVTQIGKAGIVNYTFDLLNRLTNIDAIPFQEKIDEYDPIGNIKKITFRDSLGQYINNYKYDELYRLTLTEGLIKEEQTFDSLSNPLTKNGIPCQVNGLNQLKTMLNNTYEYDLNGNRFIKKTSDNEIHCEYDAKNRLTAVWSNVKKVTFQYDSENRRLSKTKYRSTETSWEPIQTVRFIYQGNREIGSCDEKGKIHQLKVLGKSFLGNEIGSAIALELLGEVYAPITDHIGNIVGIVKAKEGTIFETYRYSPFGEEYIFNANGDEIENPLSPWRYASKRKDNETGLIYYGHRYYDSVACRWLTTDPAGFVDGMNLYSFNFNNPLRYIDKDGRFIFAAIPIFMVTFGIEIAVTTTTFNVIAATLGTLALSYGVYESVKYLDQRLDQYQYDIRLSDKIEDEDKEKNKNKKERPVKPRFDAQEIGTDDTKAPSDDLKWHGKGEPGSKKGSWHNPENEETLRLDLDHPPPIKPHWDYTIGEYEARLYFDGTFEWKK